MRTEGNKKITGKTFGTESKEEWEELFSKAERIRVENFDRKICFYAPSFMYYRYYSSFKKFPNISLTGKGCALNCKHCGGRVLRPMYPATSPEKLWELGVQLKNEGAVGCLISGGCLPDGSVPFKKFYNTIEKIKSELGLTIIVHTGLIDLKKAMRLKNSKIDAALIDIIGSNETINEIYNLDTTVEDYKESLKALQESNINFIPHVIVGLHYGKLKGELHALRMIQEYPPSALVIIAFMPIHGTQMESVTPPKPMDIAKVTATTRLMFPKTPLSLGCMRPKGKHRIKTDILALKSGVNAIAFPTEEAINAAKEMDYEISFSPLCCSQVYSDFT
ncbi:MAG: radical SAM protein [Thermoproteota archaeon]